jgi:hypothetical protein
LPSNGDGSPLMRWVLVSAIVILGLLYLLIHDVTAPFN